MKMNEKENKIISKMEVWAIAIFVPGLIFTFQYVVNSFQYISASKGMFDQLGVTMPFVTKLIIFLGGFGFLTIGIVSSIICLWILLSAKKARIKLIFSISYFLITVLITILIMVGISTPFKSIMDKI